MIDFTTLSRTGKPLLLPSAHDALSSRMIEEAGFAAYGIGGAALSATQLALPDAGLQSFGEYRDAVARIMEGSDLPVMVDGEDGFGDAKAITRTVKTFGRMGVSAIAFEDLVLPPRLDRPPAICSQEVMEGKLRAALEARGDLDIAVVGRTDASYVEGLDTAIARAKAYANLGVDAIVVPGLPDREAFQRLRDAVNIPIVAVLVPGSPWFAPDFKELAELGIEAAVCPVSILTRVIKAIEEGLAMLDSGSAAPAADFNLTRMGEITRAGWWRDIDGRHGA